MRLAMTVLTMMFVAACNGEATDSESMTSAVRDAGEVAAACTCIDLSSEVHAFNAALCDCPTIEYGCAEAPKTYDRLCDVAPPCWEIVEDPETGCDAPSVPSSLGAECSCVAPDGGTGG